MNLFPWTVTMDEDLTGTFSFLKQAGYDFIETPINDTNVAKWEQLGQTIRSYGLDIQACSILPAHLSLIDTDPAVRRAGIDYLKGVVDCTAALGANILMGPFFAGFNTFTGQAPTEEEWTWSVTAMREIANHAQTRDVTLAVEYLNRFEIYLITSADELVRYLEAVNHPNCQAAFDTFHGNIEEKSIPAALRTLAPYLVHIQLSENDRSTPGQGHVDFDAIFDTLQEINYTGPIAIEAFGQTPPEMASAAHIWRKMFASPEQLAVDSMAFLKAATAERILNK
ncbi:sugar phosphate isomerase/epimerase family protein [Arsenicibacter rosenii]|nr:sugar phosphate isomerase/epimerase family protein [Arsenicibacter rosenii]